MKSQTVSQLCSTYTKAGAADGELEPCDPHDVRGLLGVVGDVGHNEVPRFPFFSHPLLHPLHFDPDLHETVMNRMGAFVEITIPRHSAHFYLTNFLAPTTRLNMRMTPSLNIFQSRTLISNRLPSAPAIVYCGNVATNSRRHSYLNLHEAGNTLNHSNTTLKWPFVHLRYGIRDHV